MLFKLRKPAYRHNLKSLSLLADHLAIKLSFKGNLKFETLGVKWKI